MERGWIGLGLHFATRLCLRQFEVSRVYLKSLSCFAGFWFGGTDFARRFLCDLLWTFGSSRHVLICDLLFSDKNGVAHVPKRQKYFAKRERTLQECEGLFLSIYSCALAFHLVLKMEAQSMKQLVER